jgi:hypothetical protein
MLYIVIAGAWVLLASVALSVCRLASLSDDAHAVELSELIACGALRVRRQKRADTAIDGVFDDQSEAWRATG